MKYFSLLPLYTLRLSFALQFLFLMPPIQAGTLSIQQAANWREVVIRTGPSLRLSLWCGTSPDLAAVEGEGDPYSERFTGDVVTLANPQKSTKEKVALGKGYRFLDCSNDGRLLFFEGLAPPAKIDGLYAYDRASKRIGLVLPAAYRTMPATLSPDGKVILAQQGVPFRRVSLPDGRDVEVMPSPVDQRYTMRRWALDDYKLEISRPIGNYSNGMMKNERLIIDLRSGSTQVLDLVGNQGPSYVAYSVWSSDRHSIYFLSLRPRPGHLKEVEDDLQFDLYRKDAVNNTRAQLLIEQVNQFSVAADGMIVFNFHNVYSKRRGLYLTASNGKDIRPLTSGLDVDPEISADGTMIKYVRASMAVRSEMTYTEAIYNNSQSTLRVLIRK